MFLPSFLLLLAYLFHFYIPKATYSQIVKLPFIISSFLFVINLSPSLSLSSPSLLLSSYISISNYLFSSFHTIKLIFIINFFVTNNKINSCVRACVRACIHTYIYVKILSFMFYDIINYNFQLKYCGREAMAAPAVGDGQMHQREANEVIVKPFTLK